MRRFRRLAPALLAVLLVVPSPAGAADTGAISGIVTGAAAVPLGGICVQAGERWTESIRWTETADDGSYSFESLPDGSYSLRFVDCRPERTYLSQWYDGASSYWDADGVSVSGGETVAGIDVALELAGSISGTIVDDEGNPAGTCVAATNEYGTAQSWTYTDSVGHYTLDRVRAGEARVVFGDCNNRPEHDGFPWGSVVIYLPPENQPQGFVIEWFADQRDSWDATPVLVAAGFDTSGIDAVLEIAGGLTGTVTNSTGTPLEGMCVSAYSDEGYADAMTGADGFYSMAHLSAGEYSVRFDDCWRGDYLTEYYDDAPSPILADPIGVVRKIWTENVDASLAKRPRPDLTVTRIHVRSVPIVVNDVSVASNPWLRRVTVDFENVGNADAGDDAMIKVWVRTRTDGREQLIGFETAALRSGMNAQREFEWNGFGSVGDVYVIAQVCERDDGNQLNNVRVLESYVAAGGTGFGFRPASSSLVAPCSSAYS